MIRTGRTKGGSCYLGEVLVIMYHYVRDERAPWQGLKGLSLSAFCEQVDVLCRVYEPVFAKDLDRFLNSDGRGFILTFDDGLRDHYEFVFPELKRRGLEGWFFVPTLPLAEGKVLLTHKQHILQYCIGTEPFYEAFLEAVKEIDPSLDLREILPTVENLEKAKRYLAQFPFYTPLERLFRMARDCVLPKDVVYKASERVFKNLVGSDRDVVREFYLDKSQLIEMAQHGMIIGGHTHSHTRLTDLGLQEQRNEILTSLRLLSEWTNQNICAFAYPFGSYNQHSVSILETTGVTHAFTTEVGFVQRGDCPLTYRRIDCSVIDSYLSV